MVKGFISCKDCVYLDKTRKQNGFNNSDCFRYGCNARIVDKFICGWISKDSELKKMGCSDCNKLYYGTVFQIKESPYKYIYLGKVEGKRCLHNISKKETEYVTDEWIADKSITVLDYHSLFVVYHAETGYGFTGVENLLRLESKQSKQMIRAGIMAVIRADGIKQARERKQMVIEKWENENLLPFY